MISFKIGNENRPVVELRDFDKSIFARQYRTALNIADVYFRNQPTNDISRDNAAFQGIAFCGERGEGKTSAMLSLLNIFRDADKYVGEYDHRPSQENDGVKIIKEILCKDTPLLRKRTSILTPIDPTRFTNYNILEVILSELYDNVNRKRTEEKETVRDSFSYNEIYRLLQNVKRSIEMLSKPEDKFFDTLEDLEDLSSVIKLQENLRALVREYLRINNTDRLIIPIDDMDMKITGTFKLTECLRKYLSMPEVIVLMSVKPEQLLSSVKHALRNSLNNDKKSFSHNEIDRMAEKYVTKLLPQGCRVNMTMEIRIFDEKFKVQDQNDEVIYEGETLKDGILELIFIKTRYLFYNSLGEVSTLFPTNLRELVHLIGMIVEMRDIEDKGGDIHRANQEQFKDYFFTVWTECLDAKDREKALEWSRSTTDYTLNKDVVTYLKSKLSQYIKQSDMLYSPEEDDVETYIKKIIDQEGDVRNSILDSDNYTYNVSLGDVFFILAGIEKEVLPDKDYKLIFFIRSLYSIKMYDKYDYITHNHLMFPPGANSGGIYRNDERFNHVNVLQRLVGGSYFTFVPRDLIAGGAVPIDRRVIKGRDGQNDKIGLNRLIREVVTRNDKNNPVAIQALQMAEFFAMTISHAITSKKNMAEEDDMYPVEYMGYARKESNPIAFSKFSSQRGYYEFNLLAPFANLVNIRYAYYRFEDGEKLFKTALENPESLLCRIWANAWYNRVGIEGKWGEHYVKVMEEYDASDEKRQLEIIEREFEPLVSVAVIRNAEVLVAMSDHFRWIREEISRNLKEVDIWDTLETIPKEEKFRYRILNRLRVFYKEVASSKTAMSTHRFSMVTADEKIRHIISFSFCHILSSFLESLMDRDHDKEKNKNFDRFFEIYDWKDEKIKGADITVFDEIKPSSVKKQKITVSKNNQNMGLKAYIRILFKESQFTSREKISFDELFQWLTFPGISNDPEVIKCIKAVSDLRKKFTTPPYLNEVVRSAWIERIDITPGLWYDLFSNQYFQKVLKDKFELLDLSIELGPKPKDQDYSK